MLKNQPSKLMKISTSVMCTAFLFACSNDSASVKTESESLVEAESLSTIGTGDIASVISEKVKYTDDDFYTDWDKATSIQLNGSSASYEGGEGVVIDNETITITASGVYTIKGTLEDGQIVVDTKDDGVVRLVLDGAEINSSTSSAIYGKKAEKIVVSLAEDTENQLSDGTKYVYENPEADEPNAALYSKGDLTINGNGKLVVNGNYNDGITSKDDLKITGGTIQVHAADDGLLGKDLFAVRDGNIVIDVSGDGIKSTNDTDDLKGNIVIEGGTFDIKAADDGIQSESSLLIVDGVFNISSGGGSPEKVANVEMNGRAPERKDTETTDSDSDASSISAKGLKANEELAIAGGTFTVDSLDDGIHSDNSITITGGDLKVAAGDDGIHADTSILIKDGNIEITKSKEGIESNNITILDGKVRLHSADDGINSSGGDQAKATEQQADVKNHLLTISGGYVYVDSDGDGLDSNGSISMTGGTVIVDGPKNNGNGALDYDEDFEISGGVLVAVGSSGMAMATSENSTQKTLLMTYPEMQTAGTLLHLEDSKGNTIATFASEKDYQSVVISTPELKKDSSYTLYSGGKMSGKDSDGFYEDGDFTDGRKVVEFTISDTVTWLDESGVTSAKSFGPGGMGAPNGMEHPKGMKEQNDGQTPPEGKRDMGKQFSDLDEETGAKVQNIMDQQRDGTITWEEAQKQLEELGIVIPRDRDEKAQDEQ